MPSEENKDTSEYGKMPVWQWIIVYLVVAVIIYGLFYIFILYKNKMVKPYGPQDQSTSQVEEMEADLGQESEVEDVINENITEIQLTDEEFTPNTVTVTQGSTVTWINNSSVEGTVNSSMHPTHEDYLPLNLGGFQPGESLILTFGEVGTFKYHNHLNPSQYGTVVVVAGEEDLGTEDEQSMIEPEL